MRFIYILLGIILFYSPLVASPKYINAKPLHKLIKGSVGNVRSSSTTQVPIITWGGDIATIYANGNASYTKKNSLFSKAGLNIKLVREDSFPKQLQAYMSGKSPYIRCTMGMCAQASELLNKDSRTKPVIIYQLTWSAGGDALVVKSNIKSAKDLKGKTIAIQAYGPHLDYLTKVLSGAGLSVKDVKIKYLADLTATNNSPMSAFYENDIDAAFVIIPDALALTSNGTVGTGSEDSVKGAHILLSTKTANRIISDVYAVRSDYYKAHKSKVEKFVKVLFKANEETASIMKTSSTEKRKLLRASGKILLDSKQATADTEGLYLDAEFVGYAGNLKFFTNKNYPRNLSKLNKEIQKSYKKIGILSKTSSMTAAKWNYTKMKKGLKKTSTVQKQHFDTSKVASVVARKQQQGTLAEGEIFSFEVFFQPNQNSFSADMYETAFTKIIDLSSTYGGALITVEGHSDPMGYLKSKKKGSQQIVLSRIKQSAKNLSLSRAVAVRDSVMQFAKTQGVSLDPSQFAVIGQGIMNPKTGLCGSSPCAPKTEKQWRSNMRVKFRIIQVEAETSVFSPL